MSLSWGDPSCEDVTGEQLACTRRALASLLVLPDSLRPVVTVLTALAYDKAAAASKRKPKDKFKPVPIAATVDMKVPIVRGGEIVAFARGSHARGSHACSLCSCVAHLDASMSKGCTHCAATRVF